MVEDQHTFFAVAEDQHTFFRRAHTFPFPTSSCLLLLPPLPPRRPLFHRTPSRRGRSLTPKHPRQLPGDHKPRQLLPDHKPRPSRDLRSWRPAQTSTLAPRIRSSYQITIPQSLCHPAGTSATGVSVSLQTGAGMGMKRAAAQVATTLKWGFKYIRNSYKKIFFYRNASSAAPCTLENDLPKRSSCKTAANMARANTCA